MKLKELTDFLSGLDITGLINAPEQSMYIRDNIKKVTVYSGFEFAIKNVNAGDASIRTALPGAKEVNANVLAEFIFDNTCREDPSRVDKFVKNFKVYYGQARIQKELKFAPSKSNLDSYVSNDHLNSFCYHSSSGTITLRRSGVMWFSLDKSHAILGWHKNMVDETDTARTYVASVNGRIATDSSMAIKSMFKTARINIDSYIAELVSNPSAKEVFDQPGTKLLIAAGFDGFIYMDYNPLNFDKELEALVLFNLKAIQNWKLLKETK